MSDITLKLCDVLEYTGGTWDLVGSNTIISGGRLGLEHYDIFDESYRPILNGRIFDHYMNMDIGTESIDMFILGMRRRMNEIMPRYNKMYLAELREFDPLVTTKMVTTETVSGSTNTDSTRDTDTESESMRSTSRDTESEGRDSVTSSSTSDTTGSSRAVSSETPQTQLMGNADYATSASDSNSQTGVTGSTETDTSTSSQNSESGSESDTSTGSGHEVFGSETDSTQERSHMVEGYTGSPADLMRAYRESLVSVDAMVISELRDLFMLVFRPPMGVHPYGLYERFAF